MDPPSIADQNPPSNSVSQEGRPQSTELSTHRSAGATASELENHSTASSLLQRRGIDFGQGLAFSGPVGKAEGGRLLPKSSWSSSPSPSSLPSGRPSLEGDIDDKNMINNVQEEMSVPMDKEGLQISQVVSTGSLNYANLLRGDEKPRNRQAFQRTSALADESAWSAPPDHLRPFTDGLSPGKTSPTTSSSSSTLKRLLQSPILRPTQGGNQAKHQPTANSTLFSPPFPRPTDFSNLHDSRHHQRKLSSYAQPIQANYTDQMYPSLDQTAFQSSLFSTTPEVRPFPDWLLWEDQRRESGDKGGKTSRKDVNQAHQRTPVEHFQPDTMQIDQQNVGESTLYDTYRLSNPFEPHSNQNGNAASFCHPSETESNSDTAQLMSDMRSTLSSSISVPSNINSSMGSNASHRAHHQSRAYLEKKVEELQVEMAYLRERVRSGDYPHPLRGASAGYQSTCCTGSTRTLATSMESGPSDRSGQHSEAGGSKIGITQNSRQVPYSFDEDVDSKAGLHPSNFTDNPISASTHGRISSWCEQRGLDPPVSTSAKSLVSARKGSWRTEEGSNIHIFSAAGTSRSDPLTQVNLDKVEAEEEEQGDEQNKRFQCPRPGCSKLFTTSGHAHRHERSHAGHRIFACPHEGCEPTFTRRNNCRQHQRARHHKILPVHELLDEGL